MADTRERNVTLNDSFYAKWCKNVPFEGLCKKIFTLLAVKFRNFALQNQFFAQNEHKSWQ